MDIKRIHEMLEKLTECAKSELDKGIENVNTEEFSMVIDMIKDLASAEYHRSVVKAMEEGIESEEFEDMRMDDERRYYDNYRYKNGRFAPKGHGRYHSRRGYDEPMYYGGREPDYRMSPEMYREHEHQPEYYRDMDRSMGRMYYTDGRTMTRGNANDNMTTSTRMYDDGRMNESRYDRARRNYTETKEMHKNNTAEDKQERMTKLEDYMKEIGNDVMDFVKDMTPEERNLAKAKLSTLATKL